MWIFCCGAMRSGSTLQYLITCELIERSGKGQRVDFVRPADHDQLDEVEFPEGLKVFKTHKVTPFVRRQLESGNAVGIYTYRDVRDAAVSIMHQKSWQPQDILDKNFIHSYLKDYAEWIDFREKLLISVYEEIMKDEAKEVERIADFLNLDFSPEECREIAQKLSLDKQKKRITQFSKEELERGKYDPHTLLHHNHIRSGKFGQWFSVFNPEQIKGIEAQAADWLVEHNYQLYKDYLKEVKFRSAHHEDYLLLHYFGFSKEGNMAIFSAEQANDWKLVDTLKAYGWQQYTDFTQQPTQSVELLCLAGREAARRYQSLPIHDMMPEVIAVDKDAANAEFQQNLASDGFFLGRELGNKCFFVAGEKNIPKMKGIQLDQSSSNSLLSKLFSGFRKRS